GLAATSRSPSLTSRGTPILTCGLLTSSSIVGTRAAARAPRVRREPIGGRPRRPGSNVPPPRAGRDGAHGGRDGDESPSRGLASRGRDRRGLRRTYPHPPQGAPCAVPPPVRSS